MRKQTIPSVTVGISAYNEQYNIRSIIKQALAQKRQGWRLKEVLVVTDGCTDDTVKICKSIKSKYLRLIEGKKRKGINYRLKQILHAFRGDLLVKFDADIAVKNEHVITHMVKPFLANPRVMLVGGNSLPYPPKTFIEKAVYSTFEVFYESRTTLRGGHNVFGCTGSILAFRKKFAREVKPHGFANEDAFVYLACISRGYLFRYVKAAVIYYRLPKNTRDYIKQVLRSEPRVVEYSLEKSFPKLAPLELRRPFGFYARSVMKAFFRNPVGVTYVSILNLACKPFFATVSKNYNLSWYDAASTKYSEEQLRAASVQINTGT